MGLVFATVRLLWLSLFLGLPRGAHDKANTEAITVQGKVAAEAGEVELSHALSARLVSLRKPSRRTSNKILPAQPAMNPTC